jgi:hypothetical protein
MLSRRTSDTLLLLVGTCVLWWALPALAQPTAEQQSALRSNCRSDFMSNCSGVQPGGVEALQCLKRNVAKLSPGCQSAVNALNPPQAQPAAAAAPAAAPPAARPASAEPTSASAPPAAAAPAMRAATPQPAPAAAPRQPAGSQQTAIRRACQRDFMSHCAGVQPGGAAAVQCLQQHAGQLSLNCARAVVALGSGGAGEARPAPVAPTLASTPPPAAAMAPTPEQLSAVKMSCRRDFMFNCRGVQPGGPEALACLQRNAARLSPDCRTSLAAVADAAPAADTPPLAAEAAPPPRLRPVGPLRRAIRERMMEQQ